MEKKKRATFKVSDLTPSIEKCSNFGTPKKVSRETDA